VARVEVKPFFFFFFFFLFFFFLFFLINDFSYHQFI